MFSPQDRGSAVGLYFSTDMTDPAGVGASGISHVPVLGTPAAPSGREACGGERAEAGVADAVKKDLGADSRRLTNREKTRLIDRLRSTLSLNCLARRLMITPSSYHYHHARMDGDKYAMLRARFTALFEASSLRYGYRRFHHALDLHVSEKIVRLIMREEEPVARIPSTRASARLLPRAPGQP